MKKPGYLKSISYSVLRYSKNIFFKQKLLTMKKQFLLLTIVFVSVFSYGQKGSWYIGGVGGYGSSTSEPTDDVKTTSNTWAFGPEVGTFLANDIQLGFILGLN